MERSRRSAGYRRALAALGVAGVAPILASCGGARQDVHERNATFTVEVVRASFPTRQHLARQSKLDITVRNADHRTIPDIAVTIGSPEHAPGVSDTAAAAFGGSSAQTGLASSSRPIWILDPNPSTATGAPSQFDPSADNPGPVNGQTAYTNTWALGPLAAGQSKTFTWRLTPVERGAHTITYTIAAGLNGRAHAVFSGNRQPTGRLAVSISDSPATGRLDSGGRPVPSAR